jgi:hypothetical protein
MTDSDSQRPQAEQADPATRLMQHLQQQPQDLIDACRLMRHFQISPEDFTHVLNQIDQIEQAASSDD